MNDTNQNNPVANSTNDEHVHPVTLTDTNFDSEIKEGYVFVDFWADWCTPCKMVAPTIDKLAQQWKGKIKFAKLDTDNNTATASKFGIMSIPTFLLFHNGEVVASTMGAQPEAMFTRFLTENYNNASTGEDLAIAA